MANILLSGSLGSSGSFALLGSYTVTFTSDADHTMTSTEWTNAYLSVTASTTLTAPRNLIAPLITGMQFVVSNNVAQTITIVGATGTGVAITSGSTVSVICNGTNYLNTSGSTFTAAGDLSGSSTSQTVVGIQGFAVSSSAPTTNQTLVYNGTNYSPSTLPSGILDAANVAALQLINTSTLSDGTLAYVASFGRFFFWSSTNTQTPDGVTVISSSFTGGGNWLFTGLSNPNWLSQNTWYVSQSSGNDENSGKSGSPLATVDEYVRRTGAKLNQNVTIYLDANNYVEGAGGMFYFTTTNITNSFDDSQTDFGVFPTLTIVGDTTQIAHTGSLTTSTLYNYASNLTFVIGDTGVSSWTSYVGKMIMLTSGTNSGCFAWILKDLGSNTARISSWFNPATLTALSSAPATGSTYNVVTPWNVSFGVKSGNGTKVVAEYLTLSDPINSTSQNTSFVGCSLFPQHSSNQLNNDYNGASFYASCVNTYQFIPTTGTTYMTCCAFLANVGSNNGSALLLDNCVSQGFQVSAGGFSTNSTGGDILLTTAFGSFNANPSINVGNNGYCNIQCALYGSSNTTGIQINSNGTCLIKAAITPTLAATTDIVIDGSASQIPQLVAGSSVPASSTCSSWANWTGSPFNREVISFKTGSKLISA